jgi:NAD(P)-dependent dehydrogenase (short-subunit alcohol dehydrogenase family)
MGQYFKGKTALVTGSAYGIGAATALLYSAHGAKVIVADRAVEAGNETVDKIKSRNGEATFIKTDVSSPAECEQMVKRAVETYGSLDIAFNSATILDESRYPEVKDMLVFNNVVEANLNGLFYCMKYEIEAMQKQDGGVIVNMTSILGALDFGSYNPYPDTKYGIVEIGQNTPRKYSDKKIRINAVTPAFVTTALIKDSKSNEKGSLVRFSPSGRLMKTEKIAGLVIWLSSDEAPFATDV